MEDSGGRCVGTVGWTELLKWYAGSLISFNMAKVI